MSPNLPLIAWAPDADPTSPGMIASVTNMLPTARGYAPDYATQAAFYSAATIPEAALSAETLVPSDTATMLMVGTASGIYGVFGGLQTLTRASPYTAATFLNAWRFASFGSATLAAQISNVLQRTTNAAGGTAMTNVSGAPTAGTMCVQSGFVMLGNTVNTAGWQYQDGWWCSALLDETDWTPDLATQCARGRLTQTPGAIVRMVAFQNNIIAFKTTSILRGTYVGQANGIWQWQVLSTDVGLVGHNAVVEANGVLYFIGQNGFYAFDGGGIRKIRSAPWEWYIEQNSGFYGTHISGVYDPERMLVRWHYGTETVTLAYCLAYHPDSDRWGATTSNCAIPLTVPYDILPSHKSGVSRIVNFPAGFIDATSRTVRLYGVTPAASSLETGDVGDDDSVSTLTKVRARFRTAPATPTAQHFHRLRLSDPLTTGASAARIDGKYDFSQAARWHRVSFAGTGMYEILGFSVNAAASGKR